MNSMQNTTWIAFARQERIAIGEPVDVTTRVKSFLDGQPEVPLFILDADSSQPIEVDLRGSLAAVLARLPAPAVVAPAPGALPAEALPRGPGRPKLGVVAREVTLLPRHWDWLGTQPGGASVALRKLVEAAQRASVGADRKRAATESAYRFMHALAGNEEGFEDASRSLFAGQLDRLTHDVASWPHDVQAHLLELARRANAAAPADGGAKTTG
jgi:uncharacterized protein